MIGAKRGVLLHRAAKLRHHDHRCRRHSRTEVATKRLQPAREPRGERLDQGLLCEMRIPSRQIDRRRLKPDIGLDQARELTETVGELIAAVVRAVGRHVFRRTHRLNPHERIKGITGRGPELAALHRVEFFQLRAKRRRLPAERELVEALHHRD